MTLVGADIDDVPKLLMPDQLDDGGIAANQGFYTCMAAQRGLKVVALEPEVGNLRFLLSNLRANDFEVEVFPVALAERPGVIDIYGDGDTASLIPGWASARASFAQSTACNSFDNLFAERWENDRIFIKMDVEGAEHLVLSGATELLRSHPNATWLIETFPANYDAGRTPNTNFVGIFETMSSFGYEATHAETRKPVTVDLAAAWFKLGAAAPTGGSNYLFTRNKDQA